MANNEKKRITIDEVKKIYPIAREVHDKDKTLADGMDQLVEEAGMNRESAKIYITFFARLKNDESPTDMRGPNRIAARYFLKKIHDDDGEDSLRTALNSLLKHIEYYKITRDSSLEGFKKIHDEFLAKLK
ncbi:MAG: hypothetical protein ACNYPD_05450 [Candidatus Halichondribacter symbioticus]